MNRLRSLLSKPFGDRLAVYNGVAVRDRPLFRPVDHEPGHKRLLTDIALRESRRGDRVVIVGGGRGIVPTQLSRSGRDVVVFEAAREMVRLLSETKHLNGVNFDIVHAVVGSATHVYGDESDAVRVDPQELAGDVLVLDCEGAEMSILPVDGFRSVVVETHPRLGATTEAVQSQLSGSTVVGSDKVDGDVVIA